MSMIVTMRNSMTILLCCMGGILAHAKNSDNLIPATAGVYAAAQRTDIVWGRGKISPNALKGSMGESFASKVYTQRVLKSGDWKTLTPRSGPQGLDHLFIQTNKDGLPTDLLVGESKYNTSRLGKTLSGIQMGNGWTAPRLAKLGIHYNSAATANIWQFGAPPLKTAQEINVFLTNGKSVSFWKPVSGKEWVFSGTRQELQEAQRLAKAYGQYMSAAGSDKITYKKRIYHITPEGNNIRVAVYDAADVPLTGKLKSLPQMDSFCIKDAFSDTAKLPATTRDDIAKILKGKLPISDAEALKFAEDIRLSASARNLTRAYSFGKALAKSSSIAALIGMGVDMGFQLFSSGDINVSQACTAAGIVAMSTGAGGLALVLPKNVGLPVQSLSKGLGSSGAAIRVLGGGAAVATALALIDVKHLAEGNLTAQQFSESVALAFSGPAASGLAFAMVATWGTASTGAAISSLSGIAAYNATMASLGGGTLAAGGGGVLAGGMVLGGVAIVATAAVYVGYSIYQTVQDSEHIRGSIEWMKDEANMLQAWRNMYSKPIRIDECCQLVPAN